MHRPVTILYLFYFIINKHYEFGFLLILIHRFPEHSTESKINPSCDDLGDKCYGSQLEFMILPT